MFKFFKFQCRKISAILLALAVLIIASGCSGNSDYAPVDDSGSHVASANINWDFYNTIATEFITAVASGDYNMAVSTFNEAMTQGFGASGLQEAWGDIVALSGEFVEIYGIENAAHDGYFISGVILRHTNFGFGWNVVFSEEGVIHGLSAGGTIPLSALTAYTLRSPTVTARDGFTEYSIIIGENTDFPINGILSMPDDNAEPLPAVVIVHGSGAHDMDGTIHGNKPYRDIADFLASNGIAVIRHDKRTFAHGARFADELGGSGTVWHESIEDAISAAEMLRADPRVDENRVFIVGHSLGGVLAPRIHANGGNFAGLVLMAATPRNLLDIFVEQIEAQIHSNLDEGLIGEAAKTAMLADLDVLAEIFNSVAHMTIEEARKTHIAQLNTWAYYWKDMLLHPFEDYAKAVTVPILVMQGSLDFQVLADVDFVLLQELFANHDNVTFKLYEDLNHMFMTTTAENFAQHAEGIIQSPGYVDYRVLRNIVEWVLGVQ